MISKTDAFFHLLCWNIDELLVLLEPFFLEEGAERSDFRHVAIVLELFLQVAAFQTDQAVWQGVLTLLLEILLDNLHQVGQLHHGTAHHEIILSLLVLATQMFSHEILQPDGRSHLVADTDLLAGSVDELELALREEDGERDARESATATEVEDFCAWAEIDGLGNGHGVKHVVLVEVVDVFAADDIDFVVPVAIQLVDGCDLLLLLIGEMSEIFLYDVHSCLMLYII